MRRIGLAFLLFFSFRIVQALAEGDHFDIRGRLKTTYDDNVTFAHTNKLSDVLQTVLVGLDFKADTSRNSFLAQLDLSRNFYFENKSFDNTTVGLRLSDGFEFSDRLRLTTSDDYQRSEDPRSFDDQFGRSSGRYRTDRNQINLGLDFDLNSHTMLQYTYGHEYTGYSRKDLEDTDMHHTGGRVQYAFDDANRIGVGYDYSRRFFETGNELVDHTIYGDYGHSFTKQLNLTVKAGQDMIDSDSSGKSRQARYEINLLNDIDETTNAGLKYTRGLNSYAYSQDLFDAYRFSATFGKELTSRFFAQGAVFYGEGEYKQSKVRDRLSGLNAGVTYAVTQNIGAGISYSFSETKSNQDSRSYQRNAVGFQVNMKF